MCFCHRGGSFHSDQPGRRLNDRRLVARLLSGRGEGWIQAAQPAAFPFFLGGGGASPRPGWGQVLDTEHHAPPPVGKQLGLRGDPHPKCTHAYEVCGLHGLWSPLVTPPKRVAWVTHGWVTHGCPEMGSSMVATVGWLEAGGGPQTHSAVGSPRMATSHAGLSR